MAATEDIIFTYNTNPLYVDSPGMPFMPTQQGDFLQVRLDKYYEFNMETLYENELPDKINILQEIYDTERTYVRELTIVEDFFIPKLELWCPKSRKQQREMFGEISSICKTHQLLLEHLRTMPIGDVFTKFIPFLKLYTGYASRYSNALKIYGKLMNRSDFCKATEKLERDPRVNGRKLQSYLILPIQRIPRYIMLIKLLMEYSVDRVEMTTLYNALVGMQGLTEQIQSCMAAYENGQRLLDIQLSFGLDTYIVAPGRILLREGTLYKREIHGFANYSEVCVFLFNDMIIYGTRKLSPLPLRKYEPGAILYLSRCIVQYDETGCIIIRCDDVGVDLTAQSNAAVVDWYNDICDAIDNLKTLRDSLRKESFNQKAVVFDRGFWQKKRDRIRNLIKKKKALPKLEEEDFLRGQWTTSTTTSNRKRHIKPEQGEDQAGAGPSSPPKRYCDYFTFDTPTIECTKFFDQLEANSDTPIDGMTVMNHFAAIQPVQGDFDENYVHNCDWSDDDVFESPQKKNRVTTRRVQSFDEEDRRRRSPGGARRLVTSQQKARNLKMEDIRKMSYQQRTLEPFNMMSDDDEEDEIELRVKGERRRPWWEAECAPPVIKNQKKSLMDSVRSNCSIM